MDCFRQRQLVLLLFGLATGGLATGGLAVGVTTSARADSSLTTQGLAAFSGSRYAEALDDWQRAAKAGDGQAALYIGLMNDHGRGVAPDPKAARAWYERAAALGNAAAMFNIGVLYDTGTGVSRDRAIAADWYRKAAARGLGRAAYTLGLMYEAGDGGANDRAQAVRYFRQALAAGITAARTHLASLDESNGRSKRDKIASGEAAKDAGPSEFDRAQELFVSRTPGAVQKAAALLRQAADKGDLLAAYNLAYCYENGIGLQADRQQAYVWYGRAARSPTITVRRAAVVGLETVAHDMSPSELDTAKSALAGFAPAR